MIIYKNSRDLSEFIASLKKILKIPFCAASEDSAVKKCVSTKIVVNKKPKQNTKKGCFVLPGVFLRCRGSVFPC